MYVLLNDHLPISSAREVKWNCFLACEPVSIHQRYLRHIQLTGLKFTDPRDMMQLFTVRMRDLNVPDVINLTFNRNAFIYMYVPYICSLIAHDMTAHTQMPYMNDS